MQATVSRFDEVTRGGAVLDDDGYEHPFEGDALEGTGVRFLRPGQRVRLQMVERDGRRVIDRVQIITLP